MPTLLRNLALLASLALVACDPGDALTASATATPNADVVPGTAVALAATAGPADAVLAYEWKVEKAPAGSAATIANANAAAATFTPVVPGQYELSVTVSDGLLTGGGLASRLVEVRAPVKATAAITVRPNDPATLAFTTQPKSLVAGGVFSPVVEVTVTDPYQQIAAGASVALVIQPPDGSLAKLTGTASQPIVAGKATFAGLGVDIAISSVTLKAMVDGATPATSDAFSVCGNGYVLEANACVPEPDRCLTNNGGCDANATCTHRQGQVPLCACKTGYAGDGIDCADENECDTAGVCGANATCSNVDGSFKCECAAGYFGASSEGEATGCTDVNECDMTGACGNNATCTNVAGSFECACNTGFAGSSTEGEAASCLDVDECDTAGVCGANATCTNAVGTYACDCKDGFSGSSTEGSAASCSDENECDTAGICGANATCTNQPGSFRCACDAGYSGVSTTGAAASCADANECDTAGICGHNTTCANVVGSFECTCSAGFSGTPTRGAPATCDRVDPCATPGLCGPFGICLSVGDTFECACALGLTGPPTRGGPPSCTGLVSMSTEQVIANGKTLEVAASADGARIAFVSEATNLVPGDTNGVADVFVRDVTARTTVRVSLANDGAQAVAASGAPAPGPQPHEVSISGNGRFVSFISASSNLVPDDTNGRPDVFVRDLLQNKTVRASLTSTGAQHGSTDVYNTQLSFDGRSVIFLTRAQLDPSDTDAEFDVYVRDLVANTTTRASVTDSGAPALSFSGACFGPTGSNAFEPSLSPNGRYVGFISAAAGVAEGSTTGCFQSYVRDLVAGRTYRLSQNDAGVAGTGGNSYGPRISNDGRYAVFTSDASNLVEADTSGTTNVFLRDLVAGRTTRVDQSETNGPPDAAAMPGRTASLSADGRQVAFLSRASNLAADGNPDVDVFLRDVASGTTSLVSLTRQGVGGPSLSADLAASGSAVAYVATPAILPEDTNAFDDAYVHFTSACAAGFRRESSLGQAGRCLDIHECNEQPGICPSGVCRNLPGTFECELAYEPFNYPAGPLNNLSEGLGWTGPWSHTYTPGGPMSVIDTGLPFPGLRTVGGRATAGSGGTTGISQAGRSLPRQSTGSVYLQFLARLGATSGGGTPNLRLIDTGPGSSCSGPLTGGFGGNGGADPTHMCLLGCGIETNPALCSSALLSDLNLVVARIDYDAKVTQMWVNPNLARFDYTRPSAPDVTAPNFAPSFSMVDLVCRQPCEFDELRVFSVAPGR